MVIQKDRGKRIGVILLLAYKKRRVKRIAGIIVVKIDV
jgi:hypothetical protein